MLEDYRLKVFMTVVGTGSLTEAARILGITQPAVSQNIAELEKDLDCRLFHRLRTGVTLTEDGSRFLGYAEQITHWYAVARDAFSGPGVFDIGKKTVEPAIIPIDDRSQAEIWSSQGDIHISIKKR